FSSMRLPSSSLSCTFSCWSSGTPTQIREYGCGDLFYFKLLPIDGLMAPSIIRIKGVGLGMMILMFIHLILSHVAHCFGQVSPS
ncbi:hypothetical protein, partial [Bacillus altitudinis]|uniref:hypothetical protein n=1 Tax=Bacillus altitudinis TaxID=293387 RepID=UPI003D1EDC43